jgi:Na+/melibiose symporter-like transporter
VARVHPAIGGLLFLAGIVLFVVGIVDATSDAPSGGLSRKGTDTPWLIFAGIGLAVVGGILFSWTLSSRSRRRMP